MTRLVLHALAAGALLTVAACGSGERAGAAPASAPTTAKAKAPAAAAASAPAAARRGITLRTRNVRGFGTILVDARGMPIYVFTADRGKTSRCYGACARAWPVTFAKGMPVAKGGARQSLVGRTKRRDGRFQATYRGRPLYFYVDDAPGVAKCHNVSEFGGLWLLVRANGRRV